MVDKIKQFWIYGIKNELQITMRNPQLIKAELRNEKFRITRII